MSPNIHLVPAMYFVMRNCKFLCPLHTIHNHIDLSLISTLSHAFSKLQS